MFSGGLRFSGLTRALHTSLSGIKAQDQRLLYISQNIANAHVRPAQPGQMPYQRQVARFSSFFDEKSKINLVRMNGIYKDKAPFPKVFSPEDPAADNKGFVLESNVNPIIEFADMREASRAHEACTRAFEKILHMMQNTVGLLKGGN